MFQSIQHCQVAPQTFRELSDALVQIWEEIPHDTIYHPLGGMPRCCQASIQAQENYWVSFWVAPMRFWQNGPVCFIMFPFHFWGVLYRVIIFIPIKLWRILLLLIHHLHMIRKDIQGYPPSPFRSDVFSKFSSKFFEQCSKEYSLDGIFTSSVFRWLWLGWWALHTRTAW